MLASIEETEENEQRLENASINVPSFLSLPVPRSIEI
jgi:hypothetical protein